MSYQTTSKRSPPFWLLIGARKLVFFWHQSEARAAATVWNWSGKTLSPGALLAVLYFSSFHIYFSARLDFPSPPSSAPGSPRMWSSRTRTKNRRSRLTAITIIWFLWDIKEPTPLFEKSRGRRPRCCGQPTHITSFTSWVGWVQ